STRSSSRIPTSATPGRIPSSPGYAALPAAISGSAAGFCPFLKLAVSYRRCFYLRLEVDHLEDLDLLYPDRELPFKLIALVITKQRKSHGCQHRDPVVLQVGLLRRNDLVAPLHVPGSLDLYHRIEPDHISRHLLIIQQLGL